MSGLDKRAVAVSLTGDLVCHGACVEHVEHVEGVTGESQGQWLWTSMTGDRQGLWDQDAAVGLSVVLVLFVSWLSLVGCSHGIQQILHPCTPFPMWLQWPMFFHVGTKIQQTIQIQSR